MFDNKFILKQTHFARLTNVRELLKSRFNGDVVSFAAAIGKSAEQCTNVTRPNRPAPIGENLAAEIEMMLSLKKGSLSLLNGTDPCLYAPSHASLLAELVQKVKDTYPDMSNEDVTSSLVNGLSRVTEHLSIASVRSMNARKLLTEKCEGKTVLFGQRIGRSAAQVSNFLRENPSAKIGLTLRRSIECNFELEDGELDFVDGVHMKKSFPYLAQEMKLHLSYIKASQGDEKNDVLVKENLSSVDQNLLEAIMLNLT